MWGYDRDELQDYEDYDDYEDEGQEQEGVYEDEGEEEYEKEEEEPRKPTKEEMEYLELRQKLKESIRKQMKESSASLAASSGRKKKLPYDNYGSFFGPSQPVIAQRVIQESKSLLENQHVASRLSNPLQIKKNTTKVANGTSKSSAHSRPPKVSEVKVKGQKLKDTRDYSFLLCDDAELPAPSKEPAPRNLSLRNSEGRATQVPGRSKQPLSNGGKLVHGSQVERKQVSVAGHLPPKSGSKLSSTSKPSMASADSRKQLVSNSGNGPGRPSMVSADSRKQFGSNTKNGPGRPVGPKGLPARMHVGTVGNKPLTPSIKSPLNGVPKPLPSKVHSSVPKPSVEQRKDLRQPNKPKMIPKQPVASSKSQINKPLKQNIAHHAMQDHRPKSKVVRRHSDDVEDEMDISRMIRSMFNYNPNKFVDDDDDADMEAGFDEILREERRSAKIARKEDEEQLRLIEEEEERERKRRLAKLKKRRLGE